MHSNMPTYLKYGKEYISSIAVNLKNGKRYEDEINTSHAYFISKIKYQIIGQMLLSKPCGTQRVKYFLVRIIPGPSEFYCCHYFF